jgi:hypothetical protein
MNTMNQNTPKDLPSDNHNRQDEHVNAEIDKKRGIPSAQDAAAKDRDVVRAQKLNQTEHDAGLRKVDGDKE